MQTIHLRSHVGEDGILHLDIPVNVSETDLEITVTFNPIKSQDSISDSEDFNQLDWHEFIKKTAGSCADDPIVLDEEGIDDRLDDDLSELFNHC